MGPKLLKLCMYVCVGLFLFPVTALMELNGDIWGVSMQIQGTSEGKEDW